AVDRVDHPDMLAACIGAAEFLAEDAVIGKTRLDQRPDRLFGFPVGLGDGVEAGGDLVDDVALLPKPGQRLPGSGHSQLTQKILHVVQSTLPAAEAGLGYSAASGMLAGASTTTLIRPTTNRARSLASAAKPPVRR